MLFSFIFGDNMKMTFTILFLLCGIYLQAQPADSLIRVGEQFYHQKKYSSAQLAFYRVYYNDNTNAKALSNLLLCYYKNKSYYRAYEDGLAFIRGTSFIPTQHEANIYHNFALNCEALDYVAEALHYYKKANEIKQHSIRLNRIEQLQPMVDQLNAILPKIEKNLPKDISISEETKQITIPSHHPVSASLHNFMLKKMEDLHDNPEHKLDSTVQFSPVRIHLHPNAPLYFLTCHVQFLWRKRDYSFKLYVDHEGQIIDLPIANQYVENVLIENENDYIINTVYHPRGHGHWNFYTLYHYNRKDKQVEPLLDFLKHYSSSDPATFCSSIYVKDNHYRIEYGYSNSGTDEIDVILGNQWLYRKGRINTIHIPREYEKSFEEFQKPLKRFQFLEYVAFQ